MILFLSMDIKTLPEGSNHIGKSQLLYKQILPLNPTALRTAKIFGHSECNRVKS